ncbi:hypothetical protein ACFQAT_02665 [Undibacterium arcticum]|uniref:hypothetical protein n=1 Tax=Undibacterium arcticum TaxID=1762892 RepID=UPI00362241CF
MPLRENAQQDQGYFEATRPLEELVGDALFGDAVDHGIGGGAGVVELSSSETAPVIEEAAILFANEQDALVEQMLQSAIQEDDLGGATHTAWWMLFDLYQIMGKHAEFDHLSLDYASKFETSPPPWLSAAKPNAKTKPAGATPTIAFSGRLDAGIDKQLERMHKLSEKSRSFRLEFGRLTEIDPEGCALLLQSLKALAKSDHDLILVGAAEFGAKIRATLEIGRRDDNEAPWLLLLEILRLLNHEHDFEETSIDYCVTYEVSPPPFVAPKQSRVVAAVVEPVQQDPSSNRYVMPDTIKGATSELLREIVDYSVLHQPAGLDCSTLKRVDFTAAGQLLNGLAPIVGNGKVIQFHDVNHLVTALFYVMGINNIAQIFPRKY